MKYDALLDEANAEGISIKERPFKTYDGRIKGKDIYLRKDMNTTEKACVLAEELRGIIDAYEAGCQNRIEIADYLNVTGEYLQECIDCYRDKYGVGTTVDNYYIMFIPYLAVGKIE